MSSGWHSKILSDEYQNWLVVGHALSLMCDGLRPYIEREAKAFYHVITTNVGGSPPCGCPLFPRHHFGTCAWAPELQRHHASGKPKWLQSDNTLWTDPNRGYWEVAKLYMSDLGAHKADVVDASTTDTTGLVNLLFWCNHFKVQKHLVNDVRETRNTKWGHAANQELSSAEKTAAINVISQLLQDPELNADPDVENAIAEIKKMETFFNVEIVERKVMADFQNVVKMQLDDFESKLEELKEESSMTRSLVKEQKQSTTIFERTLPLLMGLGCIVLHQLHQCIKSLSSWFVVAVLLMTVPLAKRNSYEDEQLVGMCLVTPFKQVDCGWPGAGISKATCLNRGCCFNDTIPNKNWCYFRPDLPVGMCPIAPSKRVDCGWPGISKATCLKRDCCFDDTIPNTKWCYFRPDLPVGICHVTPSKRVDCGWPGISKATCLKRDCCFDDTTPNAKWCYFRPGN